MLNNALWFVLYVALLAGIGGAGYYLGYQRGEDHGMEEAQLSEQDTDYFGASVAKLAELDYTWNGSEWRAPSPTSSSTAAASPSVTVLPDRTSCAEIDGTTYRSTSERTFFLTNCVGATATPVPPTTQCGEPPNPWCYDLVPGDLITNPSEDFCDHFECVDDFWIGTGYVIKCQDGTFSKTGGTQRPCVDNGGVSQPLYSH